MNEVFVGRHPIYKRQLGLFGYELLFCGGGANQAECLDGDQATAAVILNTFVDIGLEKVVEGRPAFINVTRSFLLSDYCTALPKERVILEVLEDIEPDAAVIRALSELADAGYTIALDDFIYHPDLLPLVELANIVKVDLRELNRKELLEHVGILREYDVELLA